MKEFVYVSKEVYGRIENPRAGGLWIKVVSKDMPLGILEIAVLCNFSYGFTKKLIKYLEGIDLLHEVKIDRKIHYIANPKTYFHSGAKNDPRNRNDL
jgi:hypothetical protein